MLFGTVSVAQAASIPIGLTGWNQDVIAEASAANPIAGTTTDVATWVWYEVGAPGSSQGLPVSGSFTSTYNPSTTFQFQPYTDTNNVVNNSGTVTLTSPAKFDSLAFLTSAQGAGGESFSATLHFSDASTTVLTGSDPDWTFSGGNEALTNEGLVNRGGSWSGFYSGNLHMFEHDYTLSPADQAKTLLSIDFNLTGGQFEDLFAVSGQAIVPEPGSLVALIGLCGMGLIGLVLRRRGGQCGSI
jgi:hypothetical protein